MANEKKRLKLNNIDEILELFSKIIVINQMDLSNFLSKESKKYYKYFYIKVLGLISFYIILTIAAIFGIKSGVSYSLTILDIILAFSYFAPLLVSLTFAYLSIGQFEYSVRFYRKQIKFMSNSLIKLQLMLNFHTLSKVLGDVNLDASKKILDEIKNNVEFGFEIIPSFFKSLKRVGIISVIFSILSSGFRFILQNFSNNIGEYNLVFTSEILSVITVLLFSFIVFPWLLRRIEQRRLEKIENNKKSLNKKKEILTNKIDDFSEQFRDFLNR